jgi:beta-glucosidase
MEIFSLKVSTGREQKSVLKSLRNSKNSFLWGVATSAFQLEGSPYADWATWDSILNLNPKNYKSL